MKDTSKSSFCILLAMMFIVSLLTLTPNIHAVPITQKFLEKWHDTKFELAITIKEIWNVAEPYNVMVEIKITEMGNLYLWLNRIKVGVSFYVEQDLLVDKKLTYIGETYSTTFTLKSDTAFKYMKPGETSTYRLSVDITGEVAYEFYGKTYTLSGWSYESFDIKVYAPPAPITISASLPSKIVIYDVFDLKITITNDGDYSITRINVELSQPFGARIVGNKILTLEKLEPKANATFVFKLNATSSGDTTATIRVSYTTLTGYAVSSYTFPYCSKDVPISIISPPAPVSISVSLPPKIKLGDEFSTEVSFTNDGDYSISDLKVDLLVFGASVIGEHPLTLSSLEPKKTAKFTFQLKAKIAGNYTMSVSVSYKSYGGEWLSKTKNIEVIIGKIQSTITCSVSSEKVTKGEEIIISGALSPAVKEFVTLTLYKPDKTTMDKTILSTVDGLFNYTFSPDIVGSWTVKASWTGDLEHEGAVSSTKSFTVEEKKPCIIATTTYGSELEPEVQFLRSFRDNVVLSTSAGSQFMAIFNVWYYSFSPAVATFIADHPMAKEVMRIILYPLIGILHLSLITYSAFSFSSEFGVIMAGLVASFLIGAVYFSPLATLLWALLRRFRRIDVKIGYVKLTMAPWLISIALILIGEMIASPLTLMLATAFFVLMTISISTLTVVAVINRFQK